MGLMASIFCLLPLLTFPLGSRAIMLPTHKDPVNGRMCHVPVKHRCCLLKPRRVLDPFRIACLAKTLVCVCDFWEPQTREFLFNAFPVL